MKSFGLKDIIYILLILALAGAAYYLYRNTSNRFDEMNVEFKSLSESLARAQNQMVTKAELNSWASSQGIELKQIREDLSSLGAKLLAVGQTIATIESKLQESLHSDNSTPVDPPDQPAECKLCDIHGYTASIERKDFLLGDLPIGYMLFKAWEPEPWTMQNDELDVVVNTTLGQKINDMFVFYHEIGIVNKSRPEYAGKMFKLKITQSEFKQLPVTTKEWMFWAPAIDLGVDNVLAFPADDLEYRFGASLGFSFIAYGRSQLDNDWRFLRLGVGYNTGKNAYIILEPVQYNLGQQLPLINDLWLGIGGLYDGDWGVSLSVSTRL